jgi:hypothetical protein
MTTDLTDTQVIVLDTLRAVVVPIALRSGSIPQDLEAASRAVLKDQGLTWSDFVEFASK